MVNPIPTVELIVTDVGEFPAPPHIVRLFKLAPKRRYEGVTYHNLVDQRYTIGRACEDMVREFCKTKLR